MTRRRLLARVVGTAETPGGTADVTGGDIEALRNAIELEDHALFAYGKAAGLGVLTPAQIELSAGHLGDHQAHRQLLVDTVTSLGGGPPDVKDVYPITGDTRSARGFLGILVALEEATVQAYFAAIRTLSRAELRHTLASVTGVEAQHVVVLRQALGETPLVPHPFVDQGLET